MFYCVLIVHVCFFIMLLSEQINDDEDEENEVFISRDSL